MSVFKTSKQFYECVGDLVDRAKLDPQVGPKITKSGIVIQFRYSNPEAITTVNGPILTILKLLPAVQPLYKLYPTLLREKGYANLILK